MSPLTIKEGFELEFAEEQVRKVVKVLEVDPQPLSVPPLEK